MSSVADVYQFQLLPDLASNEYDALKADIAQNGVLIPVELDDNGALLDGHHRVRAWKELTEVGVKLPPYPSIVRRFHSEDEKVEHALKTNLMRRHLDREQLKDIAVDLRKRGEYWTLKKVGETLGVSHMTVKRWVPESELTDVNSGEAPTVISSSGQERPMFYKPRATSSTITTGPKETERALLAMDGLDDGEFADAGSEEEFVNTSTGELLTEAQLRQRAIHRDRERRKSRLAEGGGVMPLHGTYRVIYADPPWQYGDERTGLIGYSAASDHYPTMSMPELQSLPVRELAREDAVLFLWATSPLLPDALSLITAWGFIYKTSFVWDKVKHNFGHYNSVRHEFLLVATRGSCTPDVKKLFDSVQVIERTETHSQKPEEFRAIIDTLYPPAAECDRIELFRRGHAPQGWSVWGNESVIA